MAGWPTGGFGGVAGPNFGCHGSVSRAVRGEIDRTLKLLTLRSVSSSVSFKLANCLKHGSQSRGTLGGGQPGHPAAGWWLCRNLTSAAAVWATMEYIHANPVRRGLCQRATDWNWSSAIEWEQPGSGGLRIDRETVPRTDAG